MKHLLFLLMCFIYYGSAAQEFDKSINKDSLFNILLERMPEEKKDGMRLAFNEESNEASKEFLLFIMALPKSSKAELINNYNLKVMRSKIVGN